MARLQLVFNCLNMFVSDPDNGAVHVLMPASDGHGGHHRHVVRMFHDSFTGEEKKQGRSMEGWALVLGTRPGTADASLVPLSAPSGEELVDLTGVTGNTVSPDLVRDRPHPLVAARVSLYGGRITRLAAEARWELNGRRYALAYQAVWEMLDVPHELNWVPLNPKANAPIASLKELPAERDLGYRLDIHHVTPKSLPPGQGGVLSPHEMAHHFAMFYPLVGIPHPGDDLLPSIPEKFTDGVNCGSTKATLGK